MSNCKKGKLRKSLKMLCYTDYSVVIAFIDGREQVNVTVKAHHPGKAAAIAIKDYPRTDIASAKVNWK